MKYCKTRLLHGGISTSAGKLDWNLTHSGVDERGLGESEPPSCDLIGVQPPKSAYLLELRAIRIKDLVQLPSTKTVRYGLNSLRFRGSMLWNTLPDMIKSAKNDRQFKNRIKDWTGSTCCCTICA